MNPGLGLGLMPSRRRPARPAAAPFDALAAALVAAYGLRRLRSGYSGPLIRLRRTSDNAQQDFGAGAGGWLDTTALLTWAGASSAYGVTWYDQSGSGLDAVQATAASQPRLVNAGVLDVAPNGRPWLVFDGGDALVSASTALLPKADEPSTALVVGQASNAYAAGNRRGALMWGSNATYQSRIIECNYTPTNRPTMGMFGFLAEAAVDWNASIRSVIGRASSPAAGQTALRVDADGIAGTNSPFAAMATVSPTQLHVGGRAGAWTDTWLGTLSEVAVFGAALSDAQVAALRAAHRTAWGTP